MVNIPLFTRFYTFQVVSRISFINSRMECMVSLPTFTLNINPKFQNVGKYTVRPMNPMGYDMLRIFMDLLLCEPPQKKKQTPFITSRGPSCRDYWPIWESYQPHKFT